MTAERPRHAHWLVWTLAAVWIAAPSAALETSVQSGPVSATVVLTPDAAVIGDPLLLEIEAVAEPGVEVLMPDFGEALDRFAITEFVPREGLDDQGRTVWTQRYTLQAPSSGEHFLPSISIEFIDRRPGRDPAPEGMDAYELLTEALVFRIESVVAEAAAADLSPPMAELSELGALQRSPWLWLAVALALCAGAAPFGYRAWTRWRSRVMQASAYDVACRELEALLYGPKPSSEQMDGFFVKLSGIVRRYIEGRFQLRSPEYTTEEFMLQLSRSPDLIRRHQDLLGTFLEQADLVKFAHHIPTPEDIDEALDRAKCFLEETRGAVDA